MTRYLIIGNGAAGVTAAEEIRARDPQGKIGVVSAEPHPMYSRPGLAYLITGAVSDQQVVARRPEWYATQRISLIFGKATRLDTAQHVVHLDDGRAAAYDRLLIATGARATPLSTPGASLGGVVYLDTLDETQELLRRAKTAKRAVVIGGGITAFELAEGLAHHGLDTHLFARKNTLWSAVFNEIESGLLEQRITGHGVTIHYNTEAGEILDDGRGRVAGLRLATGEVFRCTLVGAAVGVEPVLDLIRATPITVERGILVNEYLEASQPGIYAAGDCAQVWDRWTQKHWLDVLWPTAVAAGRVAGANMAGARQAYVKGVPFNACLLFGLHVTVIGQIGGGRTDEDGEVVQHVDRGASEVWRTLPTPYAGAWSQDGANTVRLIVSGDRIAGALIVGRQTLADPLRYLIENQIGVRPLLPSLHAGGMAMEQAILQLWAKVKTPAKTRPLPAVER